MNKTGMKHLAALLMAMALAMGLIMPSSAELYADADEMDMVHWGMATVIRMLANVVDKGDALPGGMAEDLMGISVLNPDQAFIIQADGLKNLFEASDLEVAGRAIADAHGFEYSPDFADAVKSLQERITSCNTGHKGALVALGYGPCITLTALYANAVYGAFLVRDESLAGNITPEDVKAIASVFAEGEDPDILAYQGESLEKLLTLDYTVHGQGAPNYLWSTGMTSAKDIMETVCGSEKHIRALFDKIAGEKHMDQEVVMQGLFDYILDHYDLDSVRMIAQELMPHLGKTSSYQFMDYVRGVVDSDLKKMPAPDVNYTEGDDQDLKENATYLIVVERLNADGEAVIGCDMVMEAALPLEAIPASPQEADYIIRITVDWNGGRYTQDNLEVYYANVTIGAYDAATGVKVKFLGRYTQKLTGYMRVSSRVTYLTPYRDLIWNRVSLLFK